MARETFRKVSTTVLRSVESSHGDWSGELREHTNLMNHQIVIVCSATMTKGQYGVHILPDTGNVSNSVDTGKVLDLTGKDSAVVTFTGIITGLHLKAIELPDMGETISVVVSSFSRLRHRWIHESGRVSDYDYVSSTLFEANRSDFQSVSRNVENHRNMVYHQLTLHADDVLTAGEYKVRFVPDDDMPLETSVDTGKTLTFSNDESAYCQFGGVIRGIHLEPVTVADSGSFVTCVLSSSVERFDEILFEYTGNPPDLDDHIADKDNPHETDWDNLVDKPPRVPSFRGDWVPIIYQAESMVWDRPFTMQANTETCDRAAPQLFGDILNPIPSIYSLEFQNGEYVQFQNGDLAEAQEASWDITSDISRVFSGHKYTFTETGQISQLRVWVPAIGSDITYHFVLIIDPDGGMPRYETYDFDALVADTWNTVEIPDLMVRAGDTVLVYIDAIKTASSGTSGGDWYYEGSTCADGAPADSYWNQSTHLTLRISKLTGPSAFEVELATIVPMEVELSSTVVMEVELNLGAVLNIYGVGDVLRLSEAADPTKYFEYRITEAPTDYANYVEYGVVLIDSRGGGPAVGAETTLLATVPVAGATEYVRLVDDWTGNQPFYLTAEAYLAFDGVEQALGTEDVHGIDIFFQQAVWSSDWDIVHMPT